MHDVSPDNLCHNINMWWGDTTAQFPWWYLVSCQTRHDGPQRWQLMPVTCLSASSGQYENFYTSADKKRRCPTPWRSDFNPYTLEFLCFIYCLFMLYSPPCSYKAINLFFIHSWSLQIQWSFFNKFTAPSIVENAASQFSCEGPEMFEVNCEKYLKSCGHLTLTE